MRRDFSTRKRMSCDMTTIDQSNEVVLSLGKPLCQLCDLASLQDLCVWYSVLTFEVGYSPRTSSVEPLKFHDLTTIKSQSLTAKYL